MKIQKTLELAAIHAPLPLLIGVLLLVSASASRATLNAPYAVDANTLHLWHCDETTGNQVFDAVSNNLQTVPMTMIAVDGKTNAPVGVPTYFALVGQRAAPLPPTLGVQLGSSIQTTGYAGFYGPFTIMTNADGTINTSPTGAINDQDGVYVNDNVTNISNYLNPVTGAFTWEMLIQPSDNLLNMPHTEMLFGWDGGNAPWARALQWRILKLSVGGVTYSCMQYQDVNDGAGNPNPDLGQGANSWQAVLPSTGPDAVVPGQWYHVALTFTGTAPTNGDTPKVLTMYWTALSLANTNCHVLKTMSKTNNQTGMVFPSIGGYTRANFWTGTSGGNGFDGNIDEVRISSVCRKANEMLFGPGIVTYAPYFTVEPPPSQLVGYGKTLTINAAVDAAPAATMTWKQDGVVLPGQTNAILVISNLTFAATGNYQCFAINSVGGTNTTVCAVTVGAAVDEIYNTGVDDNSQQLAAGTVDPHWSLVQNPDPATLYPDAVAWGSVGTYYPENTAVWIGPELYGHAMVAGTYEAETHFLIDQGDVNSVTLYGNTWLLPGAPGGSTIQVFVNGVERDFTANGANNVPMAPFTLTKADGLQAGTNTLDVQWNGQANNGNGQNGFMLALSGVGLALPPGLPAISNQPPVQTVVAYGANVSLPVLALGRPPLSYQWLNNGVPVPGATKRTLSFAATNVTPSQVVGTNYVANYQVVVSNDSGSVTSAVATLTVSIPPLTLVSAGIPIWNPATNQTNTVLLFSAAVDPVTAANASNYSLDNGATVLSVTVAGPNEVVLTTSVLTPGTAYTLTVQNVKDSLGITMAPSPASVSVGTYPAAVVLWVRADTGVTTNSDGTVSQWNDLSGNGNNLIGGVVEPQLAADPTNGRPVIRFNGTNGTYLYANSSPSLAITGDLTILAVVNFATLDGNTNGMIVSKVNGNNQPAPYDYYAWPSAVRFLRGNGSGNALAASTNVPSTGVQHLLDVAMQGTTVTHRLDGQISGVGALSTAIADMGHPLSVGIREDGGNRLTGDLAELILIGSALSSSDVASMERYLATGYNLQLIPPVNTTPTNIVLSASGNQVTLSWPADHTGWQLQSNSVGLTATGAWFTVAGSTGTNQVFLTPNATKTNVFYRLVFP